MEVDYVTSGMLEDEPLQIDDNNSNNNEYCDFEGERCGLCMDIVIDRGVLDCCQHWFCFGCIDNWATITNLCPLCQTEFQLITCVPVYDTIGNNKLDEDSFSREDDWCIEGKNNTLSFPSYYIDENAVICLDGDGCKIRSRPATLEDESNLDTSIACDSCDIWYHAFCVGFDPEGTSEDTWLCPRCLAGEAQKSDATPTQKPNDKSGPESLHNGCLGEAAFAAKVSVSVADAGETALVVSMVGENKWTEEQHQSFCPTLEADNVLKGNKVNPEGEIHKAGTPYSGKTDDKPTVETQKLEVSLPCDISRVGDKNNGSEEQGHGDLKHSLSEESLTRDDKVLPVASEEAVKIVGAKRKHKDFRDDAIPDAYDDEANYKNEAAVSSKKFKAEGKFLNVSSKIQNHAFPTDDSQKCLTQEVSQGIKSKEFPVKENEAIDIMSVVRGTGRRPSKGLARHNLADKVPKERENVAGLRVKKIMRRVADDKESTDVVQNLRKEIREAVRNRSSAAIEENLFDPKLLAAFRTAIASTPTEPVKKLPPSALKAKKSMLQKGKVRENLTKKIYGNSNGRRKRAWDRDCEVEFWKHRCTGPTKPEKIETLKSVLNLLRYNPECLKMEQPYDCEEKNPILSRLYLADTSVFPRKDDVKPLSALTSTSNSQQNKVQLTSTEKGPKQSLDDHSLFSETSKVSSKVGVPSVNDKGFKDKVPSSKGRAASSKAQQDRNPQGSLVVPSGGSKVNSQKETGLQSDDKKIDKRKWALEVLARKNAAAGKVVAPGKSEDNVVLKGNFPLLAQLPTDMRPVLACSSHNKIPTSIRQTQLYRLTENLLKKLNLPEIRRTAVTELAVADAVNIEKEVADKANSKVVYLNLCSQEILHRTDNKKSVGALESNSFQISAMPVDRSEQADNELHTDPEVVDALRNAGLLSDSPPGSPQDKLEIIQAVNESAMQIKDEGPDNIFEMDSNPVDIYGDFEYDLEDEDYIGTTAMKVSNLPPEENESRMKVVFTTLNSENLNDTQDSEDHRRLDNIEEPKGSSPVPKSDGDACIISSTMGGGTDKSCILPEPLPGDEGEELSLAECEELYGPDKEPLIEKFPEEALQNPYGLDDSESTAENGVLDTKENFAANLHEDPASVGQPSCEGKSPNSSQSSEKLSRKDKFDSDVNKQCDIANSVSKKVEAYIKEHIRPLCKSGIITTEQYRWAVAKSTDKVMKYHLSAKNANFLIKEGEKVKKLAEQYVEQAQQKEKSDPL